MKSQHKIYSVFVLCIFHLMIFKCGAQDKTLEKLLNYKRLVEKNQIEKIHIHTNQPFYMNYDTIWFKAYVLNANLNRPSQISKSLNVELIDLNGKLIRQAKLKLNVGLADGYLLLSDSLKTGNYMLRAYTAAMQSFGSEFYYKRNLLIKNKLSVSAKDNSLKNSIQFFPEGGDLINEINSIVAFKALGNDGLGVDIKGKIIDDKDKTITEFSSTHAGMGKFEFKPEKDRNYFAEVVFKSGKPERMPFLKAKASGYAINAISEKDSIYFKIKGSADLENKGPLTIIGTQDGVTRYISKASSTASEIKIAIPSEKFYTGITQLTLFDTDGQPVAERLVFVNHHDALFVNAQLKPDYLKNEQVKLLVDLKNQDKINEIGSLSVSVYNEDEYLFNDDEETSIYSDLLLTTDLKGYVEKPNYYFNKPEDLSRTIHLDNLLLIQGWRRFSWKNMLSKALPIVKENKTFDGEISGKVTLASGAAYVNGDVTLFQSGLNRTILQTKTDTAGRFSFNELNIVDTAHFVVSTNMMKEKKNLKIEIYGLRNDDEKPEKPLQFIEKARDILPGNSSVENKKLDEIYLRSKGITLEQVEIIAQKKLTVKDSPNLNGPGKADVVITEKQLETTHDLQTYLVNNVNGLKIFEDRIYAREIPQKDINGGYVGFVPAPMAIVMDGMTIEQGIFRVSDINPNDIASIEILKSAGTTGIYGMQGSGGVIVINTKKGKDHSGDTNNIIARGIVPFTLIGFQKQKEFYSPAYPNANNTRDFRKAVYWNPNVVTSAEKQVELKYFNSDYTGKYKIVIEGINADGQIGRSVYYYEVK